MENLSEPFDSIGRLSVGTAAQGTLRWALADVTPLVEEARIQRDLSPLAAIGLGQLLTAAVLLTRLISKQPLRLVLEVKGNGPLGRLRAEADTQGRVRGLVERRLARREKDDAGGTPELGEGTMRVLRQLHRHNYESRVELIAGGVARNVAHFLEQSEQIRSAVLLGVLTRPHGVVAGGGLILEALPGADPDLVHRLEDRIPKVGSVSGLLEEEGAWALLDRTLGAVEHETLEERPVILTCDCDRERFRHHLKALHTKDPTLLDDDETRVQCAFCGEDYVFRPEEVRTLH